MPRDKVYKERVAELVDTAVDILQEYRDAGFDGVNLKHVLMGMVINELERIGFNCYSGE